MGVQLGALWGLTVFGFHFSWLYLVFYRYFSSSFIVPSLVYCFWVVYFTATVVGWFALTAWISVRVRMRWMVGIGTTLLYWLFIVWGSLAPLCFGVAGYPFINPCIPLATQHWFLSFVCACGCLCGIYGGGAGRHQQIPDAVGYVKPCYRRVELRDKQASWLAHKLANSIRLLNTECKNTKGAVDCVLVAPETSFPYALNLLPECLNIIGEALEKDQHLLLGSIYQRGDDLFQTVYWIERRLINTFYVKKILAPFSERVPTFWRWLIHFAPLGAFEFSDKTEGQGADVFEMKNGFEVQPRICFEFFFLPYNKMVCACEDSTRATFFFVNDSWFDFVFRSILYNLAVLKTHMCGLPMVYIGHYGCNVIKTV